MSIRPLAKQRIDWEEDDKMTFRSATEEDCALILTFIKALADYAIMKLIELIIGLQFRGRS